LTHKFKSPPDFSKTHTNITQKPTLSWRGITGMKLPPNLHARKMGIKTKNIKMAWNSTTELFFLKHYLSNKKEGTQSSR
jgi:hypothetical protein